MTDTPESPSETEWAIVHALQNISYQLQNLGHAHVRLDANARFLIARTLTPLIDAKDAEIAKWRNRANELGRIRQDEYPRLAAAEEKVAALEVERASAWDGFMDAAMDGVGDRLATTESKLSIAVAALEEVSTTSDEPRRIAREALRRIKEGG